MILPSLNAFNCENTLRVKTTIPSGNEMANRKTVLNWAIRSQGAKKLAQGSTTTPSNLTHIGRVNGARMGRFFRVLAWLFVWASSLLPTVVEANMLRNSHNGQVFDSVVGSIPINMVDDFTIEKIPAKIVCHNESMFPDITLAVSIGMAGHINRNIAPVGGDKPRMIFVYNRKTVFLGNPELLHIIKNESLTYPIMIGKFQQRWVNSVACSKFVSGNEEFLFSHNRIVSPHLSICQEEKTRNSLTLCENTGKQDKEPVDNTLEIKAGGDTVIVRGIPDITIGNYSKGMTLAIQHPEAPAVTMLIDKGKYYNIYLDDVDAVQSDLPLLNKFTEAAARDNAIAIDTDVLGNIYADAHADNIGSTAGAITGGFDLGASGAPIQITKTNVLDYIVDCGTVLGENEVQDEDCWMVITEWMAGMIQKSDLKDSAMTGDAKSVLRTNLLGKVGRFDLLKSNLLPTVASGTESSGFQAFYVLFGNKDALSFANQFTKTQKLDSELTFAQIVRGLNVYGYKVINPQGLGYMYVRQ